MAALAEIPDHLYIYTRTAWRVVHDGAPRRPRHWQGGDVQHRGADCPVCERPLLLVWDLDCSDLRRREPDRFGRLERLPLYYCFSCCAEKLSYRVVSQTRIKVLGNEGRYQGDDFPYAGFPEALERVPIGLEPVPVSIHRPVLIALEFGVEWLMPEERRDLARWFGARARRVHELDLIQHQVGGAFPMFQGHQGVRCPYKKCRAHWEHSPAMKELAAVYDDPARGLPLFTPVAKGRDRHVADAQVVFHICRVCLTLSALNRAT